MVNEKKCIVWGTELRSKVKEIFGRPPISENSKYEYDSPRAGGKYIVSFKICPYGKGKISTLDLITKIRRELNDEEKVRLSGYIAEKNLLGKTPLLDPIIKDKNWPENLPLIPKPKERIYLLLKGLGKSYPDIGSVIYLNLNPSLNIDLNIKDITPFLYALSYCLTEQEFRFLIDSLEKSKILRFKVAISGVLRISKLLKKVGKDSKRLKTKISIQLYK